MRKVMELWNRNKRTMFPVDVKMEKPDNFIIIFVNPKRTGRKKKKKKT